MSENLRRRAIGTVKCQPVAVLIIRHSLIGQDATIEKVKDTLIRAYTGFSVNILARQSRLSGVK